MRTDEFDFELPSRLIARFPGEQRASSRLLHVDAPAARLTDSVFSALPEQMRAGDVVVFNDTRVIKARLFGRKDSGGQVELLVERITDECEALCFIRASHAPRAGAHIILADNSVLEVLAREHDLYRLRFHGTPGVLDTLERIGELPLPPYLERPAQAEDDARYQTVFARHPGAVAAPTAGLHFDEAMLQRLDDMGVLRVHVTLHVGAGTFQPVRAVHIADHVMHSERYHIPDITAQTIADAQRDKRRILAVGTTSLRALEAAAPEGKVHAGYGETRIFITPGYRFRVVDRLLTNFHLPRSTLLMLVSAFGGVEPMRAAYAHAIANEYRFFSYGDAMLIERALTS